MTIDQAHITARQILEIIPLVMRVVAFDLRQSGQCVVPAHFRLLRMLADSPRTLTELAEIQAVSLPTMSSTISTLEERGWVSRSRSAQDRRVVAIQLTETGRTTLAEAHEFMIERLASWLQELGDPDAEKLTEGLEVLHRVFESATPVSIEQS